MTAFVLGNGVSRACIDVNRLLSLGTVYGCNALYRTHTPTVLVATDAPIAKEIQESGYSLKNKFYTRKPLDGFGALTIPTPYVGFSSGPVAAALAAAESTGTIYLLGFDLGPDNCGKFNNIYAGTTFYKAKDAFPTYSGNWIDQLKRIMRAHKHRQFCRICGPTTADIPELNAEPNLKNLDIDDFISRINR